MQVFECVLFDTEFTAWEGSKARNWSQDWEHREIIQLAAVKLRFEHDKATIAATFNEVVCPKFNSDLSEYIVQLTGITQKIVDEMGVDFSSAISLFHDFCHKGSLRTFSWGDDMSVLDENCALNNIAVPDFASGFANLQRIAKKLNVSGCDQSSGNLAKFHRLDLQGHQHNALFDVRSTVMAINHWLATGQLSLIHLAQ
ncbi:exonuclease domain-containing protein [Aliiglaciecola sp. M165]|nr:exonuclease domain-containing protein [Aliiglaciecola sp. M165]